MKDKIPYVAVDSITGQIMVSGVCNCAATFAAQAAPTGCNLVEFVGGIQGHYIVNGEMQKRPPA